jgi:hypothetical protein
VEGDEGRVGEGAEGEAWVCKGWVDEDNGSNDLDGLAGEVEEGPELMQNSNERSRRREG